MSLPWPEGAAIEVDRLDEEELRGALEGCNIGREIVVVQTTTSTNDSVWQRTSPTTPEGLVVFAERQTAGRGQRGNPWESLAGKGLWFSILLRPEIRAAQSGLLTHWAAASISEVIAEEFGIRPVVKAPNDVYLEERKLAGVLVEMRAQRNAPHAAIAGIGINVNHTSDDFSVAIRPRAISLAQALGRQINRPKFAIAVLRKLDVRYRDLAGL